MSDKTYDDLKVEADNRWRDIQRLRAQRQHELFEQIANAPDVLGAPALGTLWSHPAIACDCGGLAFTVLRYGCLNGVRDKCDLKCQRCAATRTWNWATMAWQG